MHYESKSLLPQLTTDLFLDVFAHRILFIGREMSLDPKYKVSLSVAGHSHTLEISGPSISMSLPCDQVQLPGKVLTAILKSSSHLNQPACSLDDTFHRVVNIGVDISSKSGVHAAFVTDLTAGVSNDYLLVATSTTVDKIQMGGEGWKIPPNTGAR